MRQAPRVAPTLGDVIGAYKSLTTLEYGRGVRDMDWSPFNVRLWQRNYYEHIIRNDEEWDRVREYIAANPMRWETDVENPNANVGAIRESPLDINHGPYYNRTSVHSTDPIP